MAIGTNIPGSAVAALTNSASAPTDIRDISPPMEIASIWTWILWGLVVALVVAVALAIVAYFLIRRKKGPPPAPPVPAHVRAKELLEQALTLLGQPKPFVIAVSDATRRYLEERFEFRAPERTTEEFLHELTRTELLTPDQKGSLGDFLQRCDLVKFAQYEPGEVELRELHGAAVRLVEETEPIEAVAGAETQTAETVVEGGGS